MLTTSEHQSLSSWSFAKVHPVPPLEVAAGTHTLLLRAGVAQLSLSCLLS